jgi:3-oxo-5-alpha-steroid 4-dehydrogenase 1
MDQSTFHSLVLVWMALALLLMPVQLRITAPYGRHARKNWRPAIDNRLGWVVMEIISPLVFAYFFLSGDNEKTLPMWVFFGLWLAHYANRSVIFPLRTRTNNKKIPLTIVLSAMFFNTVNGFLNGYWLGALGESYPADWLRDPRFVAGFLLFLIGFFINFRADNTLIRLRAPGENGYKIPEGGLFRYISCPNHFGEIVEWSGFALMCWNLPALSFAVWTAANLIPRAVSHHRWYRRNFEQYPKSRKAVIPFFL